MIDLTAFPSVSRSLSAALLLLPVSVAMAQNTELDTVVVSSAGQDSVYDIAQPVTVLDKNAINANPGATLGTLLEGTPGISNASFGPGVGRPVLRGMSGSRVKILQNGSDSADLSAMSSDHSPMAEATSAEQIEIIHGPATLLYGGGAIGGVVNLIDRRIHEQPLAGLHGQVSSTLSSVDNGHNLNALLDSGQGNWVLHLDGFQRSAGDYSSGSRNENTAEFNRGRIANSDSKGQGGAVALSWADGEEGFAGITLSTLEYDYGVPNTDGEEYRVKPSQTRLDVKGGWRPDSDSLLGWVEEWRSELSFNDYQHDETDGALVVGLFEQQTTELQSRIRHRNVGAGAAVSAFRYNSRSWRCAITTPVAAAFPPIRS
ncbi:MAG: TonB-dependent receptor plug domain-containing protein [Saccharospirillaceae bacterium]|nr:TonB-dependent receptor plug domain-containing protein [Saccharospirillaceae bacterium]